MGGGRLCIGAKDTKEEVKQEEEPKELTEEEK